MFDLYAVWFSKERTHEEIRNSSIWNFFGTVIFPGLKITSPSLVYFVTIYILYFIILGQYGTDTQSGNDSLLPLTSEGLQKFGAYVL